MNLVYLDDSKDEVIAVFSALAVPVQKWNEAFQVIKRYRKELREAYGIFVYKEFHAWEFVSGRGRISDEIIPKFVRCEIFKKTLGLVITLPGVKLFNACFPKKLEARAFERLLNRINRTMESWGSWALLICDEGKEESYTRILRRMMVYNPIPSKYGDWQDTGHRTKNIVIERIVEDPMFKDSSKSYFVQLVDFCAYSLLRRERPIPSKTRYGLHKAFSILEPILVKEASRSDPEGIVRI